MILETEKLEKLLLANWTKFINYRTLLQITQDATNAQLGGQWAIEKLTLTRFEYIKNKFIVWVEFTAIRGPESVAFTSEFHLTDELIHISTVKS